MAVDAYLGTSDWLAQKDTERLAQIAARKADEHHIRCRDCGRLVGKALWVKKDSNSALNRIRRPLCAPCFDQYD